MGLHCAQMDQGIHFQILEQTPNLQFCSYIHSLRCSVWYCNFSLASTIVAPLAIKSRMPLSLSSILAARLATSRARWRGTTTTPFASATTISRGLTRTLPTLIASLVPPTCTRSLPVRIHRPVVKSGYSSLKARLTSRQTPSMTVPAIPRKPAYCVRMPPQTVQSVRPPLSMTTISPGATSLHCMRQSFRKRVMLAVRRCDKNLHQSVPSVIRCLD